MGEGEKVRRCRWVTRKWVDHRAKEEEADNMDNTSRVASPVDWLMRLYTHLLESRDDVGMMIFHFNLPQSGD